MCKRLLRTGHAVKNKQEGAQRTNNARAHPRDLHMQQPQRQTAAISSLDTVYFLSLIMAILAETCCDF
jgi:hypothetical protein